MTVFKALPTQARLKFLFDYRDDGVLIWKNPQARRCKVGDVVGYLMPDGYTRVAVDGDKHYLHRLIKQWHEGNIKQDEVIDHHDNNPANNKIKNLKSLTQKENSQKRKQNLNNTSGLSWVSWYKNAKKWKAQYHDENGIQKYLGLFTNKYEAYHLAAEATAKIKGENHKEQLSVENRHGYIDWLLEQNPNPDYDWMNE